ncbi:MAG: type II toxin-antitoxin system RelE/ParE family toxin [Proteobacteria bacterium]|nr:type II toxin-antitoxin system RelE/ParE family toxin [Pseudomonadota bacterium]MBU1389264.1 type II toxin-antitoxin system RelE/ParE family toxin [Pseudomonadota bacterium]MBU1544084.1 type II toxin-antitoxin system RelE/ParE family toxin [Pseudomonadota bacterium]MBU2431713.1 type II toxin-antitoxin system RelE/ParE family toxin [Pseudomonadota bacterium]MBU2480619.1 type II toxin-antitoxin system RelE/ParE family toxin [Pseudomonadota bacterium]
MLWKVEFEKEAEKELDRIDRPQAKRILKYLFERIATTDDPRRFGEALKQNLSGLWKYRVGNYRIICSIKEEMVTVLVVRVGHRRKVYK